MIRPIVNILFSVILVLGLFAQLMLPHHHHSDRICFVNDHLSVKVEETHHHDHCCTHEHEESSPDPIEHEDDTDASCCFINNLNYANNQTKKEDIKIKEIDIRFSCLYLWGAYFTSDEIYEKLPKYEPPEQFYSGLFIVKDKGLRGPPLC